MQMCGIEVAVIDDGVCGESYPGIFVRESYLVTAKGRIKEYWCEKEESGHGSACAAIISRFAPGASIVSLKVLDGPTENGAAEKVATALKWCERHNVKICHLSIGIKSIKYYGLFQRIIRRMRRKGHIFIAAMANNNGFALPACLDGVIAVKADNRLLSNNYRKGYGRLGEPDYFASGRHILRDESGNEIMVTEGNSFAAPVITAEVLQRRVSDGLLPKIQDNFDYVSQYFTVSEGITVPVVVFHGARNRTVKQARRFRAYLEYDGYLAIIAVDKGGQEGIVRLDHHRGVGECLAVMQRYYDVDLILLCVPDKECFDDGDLYIGDMEQAKYGEIVKQLEEAAAVLPYGE